MIIYTGNYTLPIAIISGFRTKLHMQHLHSWFWFSTFCKRRLSNKGASPSYERLTSKCSFYYKPVSYLTVTLWLTLTDFNSTSILLLKMACHNNVKTCNTFYRKNCMFYLPPFQPMFNDKLFSRYYIVRGGINMNYPKKVVIFIIMHTFS